MQYTLAFDVYGTLIDTSGVLNSLKKMIGSPAELFMETWRIKQLEYSFRRGLMNKYADFSVCTNDALKFSCLKYKINLTDSQKELLMEEYSFLPVFNDVKIGLEYLKEYGHKLIAFSNGSEKALLKLLTNAKIIDLFDNIVSVEEVEIFKPSPIVYEHLNKTTKSTKLNSWLISSNPFDVIGATSYGMNSVWVQRTKDAIFDPWGIDPSMTINKLTELSSRLENLK